MEPLPQRRLCWQNDAIHGVASAVISFNDGNSGILDAMKNYGLEVGDCCTNFYVQRDVAQTFCAT